MYTRFSNMCATKLYLILNFNTLKNRFVLLIFVIERTDLFSFSHFLLASAEHAEQLRQTEAPAKLIHALGLSLIIPAVLAVYIFRVAIALKRPLVKRVIRLQLKRFLDLSHGQHLIVQAVVSQGA